MWNQGCVLCLLPVCVETGASAQVCVKSDVPVGEDWTGEVLFFLPPNEMNWKKCRIKTLSGMVIKDLASSRYSTSQQHHCQNLRWKGITEQKQSIITPSQLCDRQHVWAWICCHSERLYRASHILIPITDDHLVRYITMWILYTHFSLSKSIVVGVQRAGYEADPHEHISRFTVMFKGVL